MNEASTKIMKKSKLLVVLEYIRRHIILVVINFYLESENNKVVKFYVNISYHLEVSASGAHVAYLERQKVWIFKCMNIYLRMSEKNFKSRIT